MLQQLTLEGAIAQLEECAQRRRELLKVTIQQRRALAEKDTIIAEKDTIIATLKRQDATREALLMDMGKRLSETDKRLAEAEDLRWHLKMDKVDVKRCPTPQKKIMAALRELQRELTPTEQGDYAVTNKMLADKVQMSARSVVEHLGITVENRFVKRRYSADGQQMFLCLDSEIERTPYAIERVIPVQRPTPAPKEKKKSTNDLVCPNCGSIHTRGHRHETGLCDDCSRSFDTWVEFPQVPGQDEPEETISDEKYPAPAPQQVRQSTPPQPDTLCAKCHRPRRECWVWLIDEQDGIGWWDLGCQLQKVS